MIQKLIDAYELEREMYRKCIDTDEEIEKGRAKWNSGLWIRYKVFEDAITLAPTVDPVKHGKWINDKGIYKCTACNDLCLVAGWAHCIPEKQMYKVFKFCPNCGAKMEETK